MSFRISAGVAVLLLGSGLAAAQTPPVSPARAQLDEVRRLASVLDYPAAMTLFESVQAKTPDAIESLDGLKIQIVYLETGHTDKFLNLERWMIARYKSPKVSTDAERSVKGYLIWKGATDPTILGHALEMTRFARERAVASGEGEYQGFFDTAYGIALYRLGRYGGGGEVAAGAARPPGRARAHPRAGLHGNERIQARQSCQITRADGRARERINPTCRNSGRRRSVPTGPTC